MSTNGASNDPPNLSKLIKLLKMTTSPNDGEALTAIRMANAELKKFGGDWEKILTSHITIIGDPFDNLSPPPPKTTTPTQPYTPTYQSPPKPQAPPRPRPSPPPPPPPQPSGPRRNQYAGHCYCCGLFTPPSQGFIFQQHATSPKWEVRCDSCHSNGAVAGPRRAQPKRANLTDILTGL